MNIPRKIPNDSLNILLITSKKATRLLATNLVSGPASGAGDTI